MQQARSKFNVPVIIAAKFVFTSLTENKKHLVPLLYEVPVYVLPNSYAFTQPFRNENSKRELGKVKRQIRKYA